VRVDKTKELLGRGHKVKINIMFRGRERAHVDLGRKVMDRLVETVAEFGKAEAPPKLEGKNLSVLLAPSKK
jgi:translation initiation factor IF-3